MRETNCMFLVSGATEWPDTNFNISSFLILYIIYYTIYIDIYFFVLYICIGLYELLIFLLWLFFLVDAPFVPDIPVHPLHLRKLG